MTSSLFSSAVIFTFKLAQAVTLQNYIQEVCSSSFVRDADCLTDVFFLSVVYLSLSDETYPFFWYSQVSGVLDWMTGFTGSSITITTNDNSSRSMIVYDSLHSLLDYECLLFYYDESRTKNFCSYIELPYEWISWIHEWTLFYNFGRTE
jgi:hypothetical protein